MHVARGVPCAKVFSAKSSFTPIRESFLPRKIPAIRYRDCIKRNGDQISGPGCRVHAIIVTSCHGNDDETWSTVMPDYATQVLYC